MAPGIGVYPVAHRGLLIGPVVDIKSHRAQQREIDKRVIWPGDDEQMKPGSSSPTSRAELNIASSLGLAVGAGNGRPTRNLWILTSFDHGRYVVEPGEPAAQRRSTVRDHELNRKRLWVHVEDTTRNAVSGRPNSRLDDNPKRQRPTARFVVRH